MTTRLAVAFLGPALAATFAGAQAAEAPPTFCAGAEVVLLDAVVRDGRGRIVTDLRADELRVLEDGRPCAVTSFRLVGGEHAAASISAAGVPAAPSAATAVAAQRANVIVFLFDGLEGKAAKVARDAALDFAERAAPPGAWFAVLRTERAGLRTLLPFSDDPRELRRALREATSGADRHLRSRADGAALDAADSGGPALPTLSPPQLGGSFMAQAAANLAFNVSLVMQEQSARSSLHAVVAVARTLRAVSGRKSLLLFSEGLSVPPMLVELLDSAISEANRANLLVSALDAGELAAGPGNPMDEGQRQLLQAVPAAALLTSQDIANIRQGGEAAAAHERTVTLQSDHALAALRSNVQENLRDLAEGTGGTLVANTNDLRPGLERLARDLRTYYEIAYVPPDPEPDGRFRRIDLRVAREGARVTTRKGYYALPAGVAVVHPYELPLARALAGPSLPQEVPFRSGVFELAPGAAGTDAVVLLEARLDGLRFRAAGDGSWAVHASMLALVKDADGRAVARLSHDWPIRGTGSSDGLRGKTVMLKRALRLAPGRYTLEAAVRDRETGALGARRTAFVVPEMPSGPVLGSVSVVRLWPAPEQAGAERDPLVVDGLRALPVLGAPVPFEAGEVAVLSTVRPAPGAGPVELTLELRQAGRVVAIASPTVSRPDRDGRLVVLARVPPPRGEGGRYQVWLRAKQGELETADGTAFELVRAHEIGVVPPPLAQSIGLR